MKRNQNRRKGDLKENHLVEEQRMKEKSGEKQNRMRRKRYSGDRIGGKDQTQVRWGQPAYQRKK